MHPNQIADWKAQLFALANLWLARLRLLPFVGREGVLEMENAGQNPGISRPMIENRLFFIFLMTIRSNLPGYPENP